MPLILLEMFSKRQLEVIALLLQGKSTKLIAQELGISMRAVEYHLTHIYEKLDVSSRAEAVVRLINLCKK